MTNLERRALLGDSEAQRECTEKGIVLACPVCGESVAVYGPEDWEPTFQDPDSGGEPYWFECECGLAFGTSYYEFKQALALWNTRPAPPLGRCKDCGNWRGKQSDADAPCKDCDGIMEADNFCRNFKPKEK